MRGGKQIGFLAALLSAGCAEYQGEVHPKVVRASEVRLVDTLPEGYRLIGDVVADETCTEGGEEDLLEVIVAAIECSHRSRLERRCRRLAARNGGELLLGFSCEVESESYDAWDGDGWSYTETEKTTTCSAEVGRRIDRDS